MPLTQRSASVRHPAPRCCRLLNRLCAMIGSKALSCSCPASAAMVTVMSLPITSKAIWFTTSGITGFTLPGMIELPACTAGSAISPMPARGPLESRRRSLQTLESLTAMRLSTPESCTNEPASWVASIRLGQTMEALLVLAQHHRVGGELLAQRHRHGVLQLRAADFQDVVEFRGLLLKREFQMIHLHEQSPDREMQRQLDGARVDVVGALRQVDVV